MPRRRSSKKNTNLPAGDEADRVESEAVEPASPPDDQVATAATEHEPPPDDAAPQDESTDSDKRQAERQVRRVRTIVHFRESADTSWKEVVEVQTVSRNGAALVLSRPCAVGRIVTLVMEMPKEFRVYDHFAEVYPVAGVVQNCMEVMADDRPSYHVGVAFIGKQLPVEHRTDPTTTYRINGVDSSGLWSVVKAATEFRARRDLRYLQSIPITVSYRDEINRLTERSELTTRDVSRGGAAVWGPLDVEVGDRVKVASREHDFFSLAKVCNRTDHPREEAKCLIHLQFEDGRFPVDLLARPEEDERNAESPATD